MDIIGHVVADFLLFSGLPDSQAARWQFLCENSTAALQKAVKPGHKTDEEKRRLATAAAAMAYSDYLRIKGGGSQSTQKIKVGSIQVQSGEQHSLGQADMAQHFLQQIADLLVPAEGIFPVGDGQ